MNERRDILLCFGTEIMASLLCPERIEITNW
jgi:hypothetical protein